MQAIIPLNQGVCEDASSTSLMTNDTSPMNNKNLTNMLSSSNTNTTSSSDALNNITNHVIQEIIQKNISSGHHMPSYVNNASYLYMILSFFARIISNVMILLLLMTILLILFPSLLKPLQYAFQSILITFRTSIDTLFNLKDILEKAYQHECEEKAKQASSQTSFRSNNMKSEPTTETTKPLEPSDQLPKVRPSEKKVVRFDISTQIDERDLETLEMRGGPFGRKYRSIRKDFDTSDSTNQTDDGHYRVPNAYEFVNSLHTSTAPSAIEKAKSKEQSKKELRRQRKYADKKKYEMADSRDLRKLYNEKMQDQKIEKPESEKTPQEPQSDNFDKKDHEQEDERLMKNNWKRISISYGNLKTTDAEDFDNTTTTDSINYSSDEDKTEHDLISKRDETINEQLVTVVDDESLNKQESLGEKKKRESSGEYDFRQLTFESQSLDQPIAVHKNLKQIFDSIIDKDDLFRQNYNPTQISAKSQAVYFRYSILTQVPIQSLVDGSNISLLDLSNNYISSIPTWFATTLKSLTYLFLPNNYLYELPENFCEMKKLRELDLSHNAFEYMPSAILKLPNIITLDFSNNSLLLLPNDISLLKNTLTDLNVSYNELREIPDDIRQLKKLKYFKYNENDLFYYTTSLILSKLGIEEDLRIKPRNRRRSVKVSSYLFGGGITESFGEEDSPESKKINEQYQIYIPKRQVLLLQLLNSESEYITHLNVLNDVLYTPLLEKWTEFNISPNEKEYILHPIVLRIIRHARELFVDLKSKMLPLTQSRTIKNEDTIEISKVFSSHLEEFRELYVKYPTLYENAAAVLNKLRKNNDDFDKYLKVRKRLPICGGHLYDSFLLLPVTRLYSYVKYLQKILRYTPESHSDFKNLRLLVREMRHILQEQDEYFYRINNKYKLLEIEKKLKMHEPLLKPGRFFLKEGRLILGQNKGINNFKKDVMNRLYNKGTISDIRGQVLQNWDAVKSKSFEELLELRFTELYVQVYLMSDIIIIKETNFVQKLVSRFNIYPLKGASVVLGEEALGSQEMETLVSPGRDSSPVVDMTHANFESTETSKDDEKEEREFTLIINTLSKRIPLSFICESKDECMEWFKEIEKAIQTLESKHDESGSDEKLLQSYEFVESGERDTTSDFSNKSFH
ncbi:hypothetical protein FDP41_001279 [Naegleria fowleri]|uniref:DH domain-containing protein n=1 Tax=Naegleria fowleri TaxID=5763 RepID=A0A6A5BYK3_NAEFO|nr:uncharacterized protein FDP41_001279 [Naegleria fowleri]KAF0979611.1 hypothetical protein FDP41_001279 [Naegleria fowleri]